MSTVKIVYGDLDDARKAANKAADYCSDYAKELKKKVTNKIGSFKGGSSSYTSSAAGYANKKISELNSKESKLRTFSGKLNTLAKEAKQTDKDVKSYLKAEGRDFRDSHGMHVNRVTELFVGFCVSASNSNGFTKWVKDGFHDMGEWMDEKWEDVKYWYKCEGGKYVVKIIAGAVVAVLAVVAAVAAWPVMVAALSAGAIWGSIVAVAGFVGAVIAAADALVDVSYNIVAATQFASDPAWAARYDSFNSVSTWLDKNRFSSGLVNKLSYIGSKVISGIQTVCAVINIAEFGRNAKQLVFEVKTGQKNFVFLDRLKTIKYRENASAWTKIKMLGSALKLDLKTLKTALSVNVYKDAFEKYTNLGKTLKSFSDATKPLKVISKTVLKMDENGLIKSIHDAWKGDHPINKTIKNIETVFGNLGGLLTGASAGHVTVGPIRVLAGAVH